MYAKFKYFVIISLFIQIQALNCSEKNMKADKEEADYSHIPQTPRGKTSAAGKSKATTNKTASAKSQTAAQEKNSAENYVDKWELTARGKKFFILNKENKKVITEIAMPEEFDYIDGLDHGSDYIYLHFRTKYSLRMYFLKFDLYGNLDYSYCNDTEFPQSGRHFLTVINTDANRYDINAEYMIELIKFLHSLNKDDAKHLLNLFFRILFKFMEHIDKKNNNREIAILLRDCEDTIQRLTIFDKSSIKPTAIDEIAISKFNELYKKHTLAIKNDLIKYFINPFKELISINNGNHIYYFKLLEVYEAIFNLSTKKLAAELDPKALRVHIESKLLSSKAD